MPDTNTTQTVSESEVLSELAGVAKSGVRGFVLLGKVKSVRRVSNEKTGEIKVKADTVCGEGSTITLKFNPTDTLPGAGFIGAFKLDNVSEYMNKASADCLAFA